MSHLYRKNFNPYGRSDRPDCAVRAISAALMMSYSAVCRRLGLIDVAGIGATSDAGISLRDAVLEFDGFFGGYTDVPGGRITLDEFCDIMAFRMPKSAFVVLVERKGVPDSGHAVYMYSHPLKPFFIDTWDSGSCIVLGWAKVLKQVPKDGMERLDLSDFS